MKKIFRIMLASTLVLSMTACGSKAPAPKPEEKAVEDVVKDMVEEVAGDDVDRKPIKIGVSVPNLTNVFFLQIEEGMKAALTHPEDEVILQDANGDQNKQMNDIADMISQGVDAICLSAINSEGVKATLVACEEAGIPVIAFNVGVKDPELVATTIVSANDEAGAMCAEALAEALGGEGKVVEITYSTTTTCYDRQVGFEEKMKEYPGIEIIQAKDMDKANSDYSQPIMVDFINANPQIDGVFTINDPAARGAIAALKEAGMLDDVGVVSVDGSDEAKEFIRAGEMIGSAAQDPEGIGRESIKAAYRLIAGETVEKDIIMPMRMITKDNVDE